VFVLTDDLATNLVQYMPHVQQMQRTGTDFSNYFVTDSLCCPSRSSIFTGRFPHNTGVFTNGGTDGGFNVFHQRGEEKQTFAAALQKSGYRTGMMGKYLNGYQPNATEGGTTPYVPPGWNEWDVAGNGYPGFNYSLNENGHVVHYGKRPVDYMTDVLSRKGVSFIGQAARAQQPFMLEIATFAPHAPYTPAPRDAKKFPGLKAPQGPAFNEADVSDKPAWLRDHPSLKPKQINNINATFRKRAQDVQAVDQMIGRLQAALTAAGVAQDTYIVFSSDNGFHMGEHRLTPGKMTAFDTDIRVPLVVTGPGVPAGRTQSHLAENIDLCPTFEQLGGAPIPASVDGRSLVPWLRPQHAADPRHAVLIEHHGPDRDATDPDLPTKNSGNPPSYEAIRTANELYVEYADGEREYYDLARDPDELTNAYGRLPAGRRSKLAGELHARERCHGRTCRTA
jgi:arylsulfatase A-like enzyme